MLRNPQELSEAVSRACISPLRAPMHIQRLPWTLSSLLAYGKEVVTLQEPPGQLSGMP